MTNELAEASGSNPRYQASNMPNLPNGWRMTKLSEVADVIDPHPSHRAPLEKDSGLPFVGIGDITEKGTILTEQCRRISEKDVDRQNKLVPVDDFDIGFGRVATVGKVVWLKRQPFKYALSPTLAVVKPTGIDRFFLYFALQSEFIELQIKTLTTGTTRSSLGIQLLRTLHLPVPDNDEETRAIAAILQSVDDAIDKTRGLVEKYSKIKQGLKQDFFDNAGNQSIGSRRLVITLGDSKYFELATGGTPSTAIAEYWGGTIKWMVSGDVHKKRIYDVDGRITGKGYENSNATLIPEDSVLIALAGQGKTRGSVAISKIELTTNQSVAAVIPRKGKIDPGYLYHYLDNKYLELRSISAGAGRAGLSLSILGKYVIKVHSELSEQERVAQVLDKFDERIRSEESYQNKLLKIKDGLIRDLLSGKVRVAA